MDSSLPRAPLLVDEDDDGILSHLSSAPFYPFSFFFSLILPTPLSLPSRRREENPSAQFWVYAARFISYPTNWEARTAGQDSRTEISAAEGNALPRERRRDDRTESLPDERTGIAAAEAPSSAFLGVAGVFQLRRDALSTVCSGLGQLAEIDSRLRIESYVIIFSMIQDTIWRYVISRGKEMHGNSMKGRRTLVSIYLSFKRVKILLFSIR